MRAPPLVTVLAAALVACSAAPAATAERPGPTPRQVLAVPGPVITLAAPQDFLAGTLEAGADVVADGFGGALLRRTPAGAKGSVPTPVAVSEPPIAARTRHGAAFTSGHHYLVGGLAEQGLPPLNSLALTGSVAIATRAGATVFFTRARSALGTPRSLPGVAASEGRIYVLGGIPANGTAFTERSMEFADVADPASGELDSFKFAPDVLPSPRADFATAVLGGRLYVMGGVDHEGRFLDSIISAPIRPDGLLGPFTTSPARLVPPRSGARAAVVGGSIVLIGGSQPAGPALAEVRILTPDAAGRVAEARLASLPLGVGRIRPAVAAAGGRVLVVGGDPGDGIGLPRAEVLWLDVRAGLLDVIDRVDSVAEDAIVSGAAASSDGLDVWTTGGESLGALTGVASGYRLGGTLGSVTTALRRGSWRRVLELDRTLQVRRVQLTGSASTGEVRAAWRAGLTLDAWGPLAPEQVVLTSPQTSASFPVSVPGAVVATRWFELTLDLDDGVAAPQGDPAGVTGVEVILGPTQLALLAFSPFLIAGACTPLTLELRDGEGAAFPVAEDFPVNVAMDSGAAPAPTTVHATSACGPPLSGPVVIPAGQTTITVYARGGTAGTVTGVATPLDATVPAATSQVVVVAGPVSAVAFEAGTPPATVASLVGFDAQVRLTDAGGNPASGTITLALVPGTSPPGAQLGGTLTAVAVSGVATFTGLTLDKVGSYQIQAQVGGTSITAFAPALSVTPGAPAGLAFTAAPAPVAAGTPIASPVVVELRDASGNLASNAPAQPVTLTVSGGPPGGGIGGPVVQATTGGQATFPGLTFSVAGLYALQASATVLPPAISSTFTVFRVVPVFAAGGLVSGACTAIPLDLQDVGGGAFVATADYPVTVAVQSGPGPQATTLHPTGGCDSPLAGPVTIPAGLSTRTFWARGGTAGTLTLSATPAIAGAQPFTATTTVTAGPPAAIAFLAGSPPAQVTSLGQFSPQVLVSDLAGNPVNKVGVSVALDAADLLKGATLGGLLTATTDATGLATFSNLTLDKAGSYTLRAAVTGTSVSAPSGAVQVVPGAPAQLLFAAYPPAVVVNRAFDAPVVVDLLDAARNRCTNAPATSVTLALQGGPGGVLLGGASTQSTAAGVATFTGLSIPQQGTFQLSAASTGLPSASTGNVEVLPQGSSSPPVKLAWSVWPASVPLNTCSSEFRVEALDAADQRISPVPADYLTVFVVGSGPDAAAVTVFSDPLCATPAASVTIGAAGVASFYVKGSATKVLTVAADATLSGNRRTIQKDFQVGSAPPSPPAPAGPKPLNGWSCGTTAGGDGGGSGMVGLLALGLLLVRRRDVPHAARLAHRAARPLTGRAAALAVMLAAAPAAAQTAPAPAPAAKPKPKPVKPADVPLPPPPRGLTRTPTAEPTPPEAAPAAAPAAAPRKSRDPRPSVAVLNVEGTLTGEKLDLAALTDVLATTVDEAGWFRVVSSRDVTAVLALERQKELLGCSADQACIAELAGALGVEYVLSASVGKVGEAYLVSGRMVEAKRGTGVARASTNATGAGLVRAMRTTGRKLLEGFRAGRPEAEQARLVLPGRNQEEEETGEPGRLSLRLAAVAGLAPGADEGARRSVGVEAGLGWRLGQAWDLTFTGVGGPTFGGRVGASRALLDGAVRLSLGLRAVAWPGASAFGGGPVVELSVPLGRRAALVGHAAAEGYGAKAAQGSFAVLGGAGFQLRL